MAKTTKTTPKTREAKATAAKNAPATIVKDGITLYRGQDGHYYSVPEDPTPTELLVDAIRETLSPQAVAAIAAYLQPCRTKNASVNREVEWFVNRLVAMLGPAEFRGLMDELGL